MSQYTDASSDDKKQGLDFQVGNQACTTFSACERRSSSFISLATALRAPWKNGNLTVHTYALPRSPPLPRHSQLVIRTLRSGAFSDTPRKYGPQQNGRLTSGKEASERLVSHGTLLPNKPGIVLTTASTVSTMPTYVTAQRMARAIQVVTMGKTVVWLFVLACKFSAYK